MIDIRTKNTLSILAALVFLISACLPVAALADAEGQSGGGTYETTSNIALGKDNSLTVPPRVRIELEAVATGASAEGTLLYEWQFAKGKPEGFAPTLPSSFGATSDKKLSFVTDEHMVGEASYIRCRLYEKESADAEKDIGFTEPVQLTVFEPAKSVLTCVAGGQTVTGSSVTLDKGEQFTLSAAPYCPDSALSPSGEPRYVWERSDNADSGYQEIPGQQGLQYAGTAPTPDLGGAKTEYYRYTPYFRLKGTQTDVPGTASATLAVTGVNAQHGIYFTSPQGEPPAQSVPPGGGASCAVVAKTTDSSPISAYMWQYASVTSAAETPSESAWNDMSGSDSPYLSTSPLAAGFYCFRCIATAASGQAVSPIFRVTVEETRFQGYSLAVNGVPQQMPGNYVVSEPAGTTAAFTVVLNNQPASASYQWQSRPANGTWTAMDSGSLGYGFQSPTLTVPVREEISGYQYRCVVTNTHTYEVYGNQDADPVVSLNAQSAGAPYASLVPAPRITSSVGGTASDIRASVGMRVTFTATNASQPPIPSQYLSYQWESASAANGAFTPIAGATAPEYALEIKENSSVAYYRCQVRNTATARGQEVPSSSIRVQPLPQDGSVFFTTPTTAQELSVRPGDIVTLGSAARTDDGSPVSYQWQVARVSREDTPYESVQSGAWTAITGVDTANLTTEPLKFGFFFYRCVATNTKDINKHGVSLPFRVNVIPFQPAPVVSPPEMTGPDGGVYAIRQGVAAGETLELSVSATIPTGERPIYQWMIWRSNDLSPVELAGQTSSTLRIPNITASYNNTRIYCRVTNSQVLAAQTKSARWIISVWDPKDIPRITAQPSNVTTSYDPANPSAYSAEISVAATGSTSAHLEKFYEQRWVELDGTDKKPQNVSGDNGTSSSEASSQTYTWKLDVPGERWDPNGQYRVAVENAPSTGRSSSESSALLPPTAYSNSVFVNVTVLGLPAIVTEPADRTAKVGEQASFEVSATVTPQSYPLAYRWQVSRDGGETWTNCLSTDGTASGNAFQTVTLTEAMRLSDSDWSFRCVVANASTGQSVTSKACSLTIEPGEAPDEPDPPDDPVKGSISAAPGSDLTVAEGEVLGAKATVRGTDAEDFMKGLTATEGFHLILTYADGKPVEDEREPIGTGMIVQLVSDMAPEDILESVVVILKGDVTGSGLVNISQLTAMARDLNGVSPLQGAYLKAGDFNNTGDIDVADLVSEARILNGTTL